MHARSCNGTRPECLYRWTKTKVGALFLVAGWLNPKTYQDPINQTITVPLFNRKLWFSYLKMSNRVPFSRVNEAREQNGVPQKEDGRVVADNVPVAFFRVEFHSETPDVSNGVRRSFLTAHSRKSHGNRRLLADFWEERRLAVLRHVVGRLEVTESTCFKKSNFKIKLLFPMGFLQLIELFNLHIFEGKVKSVFVVRLM